MMFTHGQNTIYNGQRFRYLFKNNMAFLFSDGKPMQGFTSIGDNIFKKEVKKSEITNCFKYRVYCRKNGYVLKALVFIGDDKLIAYSIHGPTIEALQLDCVAKGEYEKEFLLALVKVHICPQYYSFLNDLL